MANGVVGMDTAACGPDKQVWKTREVWSRMYIRYLWMKERPLLRHRSASRADLVPNSHGEMSRG